MTPELKAPSVAMGFASDGDGVGDYTQEDYAQWLIDEYKAAGVRPRDVFPQSFPIRDIRYWIANEPKFGAKRSIWTTPTPPSLTIAHISGRFGPPAP